MYHFNRGSQPNTKFDILSMGFITPLENAIMMRIESETSNDFFELEIVIILKSVAKKITLNIL